MQPPAIPLALQIQRHVGADERPEGARRPSARLQRGRGLRLQLPRRSVLCQEPRPEAELPLSAVVSLRMDSAVRRWIDRLT